VDQLIEQMKKALAETFALYLKTQFFHWNVEGPDFQQFHSFFGDLYEEIYGAIDPMAEEIRALDSYAPGSFSRYDELSSIKGEDSIIDALSMVRVLYRDNAVVYNTIKIARDQADGAGLNGLVNFLEDRMDRHKKHEWMLRSYLK
jgi:starvation-inducible DNA-binding protein